MGKVLTNAEEPSEAVEEGLVELLDHEGVAPKELKTIVHGTTLVTNALIERRGVETALLTREGFREPDLFACDVEDALVSMERAREVYNVALTETSHHGRYAVDAETTARLHAEAAPHSTNEP